MAARAFWKGYLKLSLVTCAVAMTPARSESDKVRFHTLNRKTGARVESVYVDAQTGARVAEADQAKAYQTGPEDYLLLDDDDLDAVALESTRTIDIETFVAADSIGWIYYDQPHFMVPDDKVGVEAFAVIREAMQAQGVVGLGRAVVSRRERLFVLEPRENGLLATTLHYNYEVRDDHAYFDEIPDVNVPAEMLDLAKHIIQTKMGSFDISKFEDRYENALIEMIRGKQAGRPVEAQRPARPASVVNLMDALRKSIAAEKGAKEPEPAAEQRQEKPKPARKAAKAPAADGRQLRSAAESRTEPKRTGPAVTGDANAPAGRARARTPRKTAESR